jgi:peptide deformylase
MKLGIVKYGAEVLTQRAKPVTEFDDDLKTLVANMFETMYEAPGVGLAAPQVGVSLRVFVMDCSKDKSRQFAFINPEIVLVEGLQKGDEGCLSFPGIYFEVDRGERVIVRAQDVDGKPFTADFMELEARCVLHENDHLDGDLFINHVGPLKRDLVKRKIRKLVKEGKW